MKLNQFAEVAEIIKASRNKAIKAVNTQLIDLYWSIGKYIDTRIENAEWGQSVVEELALYLQKNEQELKGF